MKTIKITTQDELDALPEKFDVFTVIEIRSDPSVLISVTKARDSSSVEAWDSSRVVAWGSSRVVARDSSRVVATGSSRVVSTGSSSVEARDSSSVEATGSSRVEARDSSRVVATGSSRVVAWGSSRVEARDSSSVVAWGSSSVVARDSSRVVAWDSSRVVARDSSSVVAWGSSSVEAHDFSSTQMLSAFVVLTLFNYSMASVRGFKPKTKIVRKHKTTTVINTPEKIERSFSEWLKQGYVHADGITKKFLSKKKIGEIEVFEVEEFIDRKSSFVVKRGETFSHGETVEKAIESLRYKLTDRDTSKFKKWKVDTKKTVDELIQSYRAITGACEFGTKQFCDGKKLKKEYTIIEAVELTKGVYGNEKFSAFFGVKL